MKILIIGQTSSFWIQEYVKQVFNESDEIYLLYDDSYGEEVQKKYSERNVHFICTSKGVPILGRIPKIRTPLNLLMQVNRIVKKGEFDIVEFQGMPSGQIVKFFSTFILPKSKRTICMYWGSDLLATDVKKVKRASGCLERAKYIVFDSDNLKTKFIQIFGDKYNNKIRNTRLGTTIFDDLNQSFQEKSREECREFWGIREEETAVAVGYNGRERQQHLKVLRELKKIDGVILKRIKLVIHLGYGLESPEYGQEIKEYLKNNFDNYVVLENFLDKEKIAMLRRAVDIFIHAQISDALAGSVKEYLYAGAALINPSWIKYPECKRIGIQYKEYDKWEEIPHIVEELCREERNDNSENRKKMYDNFSWEALKKDWFMLHTD